MVKDNISQEFELVGRKHKKFYANLIYIEHFPYLASAITGCIFIAAFTFFALFSYRNYECFNRIKNFCNNCRN